MGKRAISVHENADDFLPYGRPQVLVQKKLLDGQPPSQKNGPYHPKHGHAGNRETHPLFAKAHDGFPSDNKHGITNDN